ncbi:porin [Solimonas fluminis]|uniref:Porin n=1 Tax=Solimonas fluminis TaxID=2086571 RepID=A0A2S5TDC4_9GAMM|nr:porin [Solimonas fluminis]PPE72993.1 porin [Solimonas fluminis]
MSNLKYAALAAFIGAVATPAMADKAETKGGLVVKTDDGRFEMKIGGRIQFDGYLATDDDDLGSPGLISTTGFRRARLTMEGKAYGWSYKFENDFTGAAAGGGFREMWIGTKVFDQNLRIGQAKPYRGMEELTSSNEIDFMERPFATASGVFTGNQFAQGLFLDGGGANWTYGISAYSLRNEDAAATEGVGGAARVTFAPILSDETVLHLGLSASSDHPSDNGTGAVTRTASGRQFGRIAGATAIATTPEERTAFGLELAGKAGPIYGQAEYVMADYKNEATEDEDVDTWYVQASYMLTGESKPYDAKKAVFKSPKPNGAMGAWELKARYDVMEGSEGTGPAAEEISYWIVGANWFVNPNVRFMFEYLQGNVSPFAGADVEASVFQVRTQFGF